MIANPIAKIIKFPYELQKASNHEWLEAFCKNSPKKAQC